MTHAQKPDFVFRQNGRVHLNRRGASVQSTTGSRGVRISGSNVGYSMFRGSVKSTCHPLHSPVSPSLPLPYVTVCHHISTGLLTPNDTRTKELTGRKEGRREFSSYILAFACLICGSRCDMCLDRCCPGVIYILSISSKFNNTGLK